ncbi:MAG: ABC transporter substrate-binding protein [Rubrivivax sp.]
MERRSLLGNGLGVGLGIGLGLAGSCAAAGASASAARPAEPTPASPAGLKVLRIVSPSETGFDPARAGDVASLLVIAHVFEPLYGYDPLARPVKMIPRAAAAMPEVSADFREWTIRLRPNQFFSDHPAFGGKPRELVAADFVYSLKRFADPATKSPGWSTLDQGGIVGLAALRREAVDKRRPFDYDRPIEGLQAIDRYTLRVRLEAGRPRFVEQLAGNASGAVAREVIQAVGEASMEHPVGTGPFRLAQWRRSSRIVLERNPRYREVFYDAQPAPDDVAGQAILAALKGRRLPMVDRVEIAIIDESQPMWLAFLQGGIDYTILPDEFIPMGVPGGRLAPYLARRGVQANFLTMPSTFYTMFNMEHPVVGGYEPHKVALRRAIALGIDVGREIQLVRNGSAVHAQSTVSVHLSGYDPAFRCEMGEYDPARARALLDLHGYRDRDGDGFREQPDGSPLLLEMATQPNLTARQLDELMRRDMHAIGLRIDFKPATWPAQYKAARAGKLMMWSVSGRAGSPDGLNGLYRYDGPASGGLNLSRFDRPEMNRAIERLLALPDGPEREAIFHEAKLIATAWMPYKMRIHPVQITLVHPWVKGFRPPLFRLNWFEYVDVDPSARRA